MKVYKIPAETKVLIFDIDSTLYTNPEYAKEQIDSQVRHFADIRGITHDEGRKLVRNFRSEWAKTHGGKKISLGNLLTHFGISIEQSIQWRKTLFDPAKYLCRDEKLIQTMDALSKKYFIICVTNNPVEPATRTLQVIGIQNYIKKVIGLDSLKKSKPAKEIFELALKSSQNVLDPPVEFNNCISIGDRYDIDLDLPLELGMGAILVDGVNDVYSLNSLL
ncbi:MAG: HAD family hydrolase [Treponema sp.]|nr:HAD family hydrolase [Treponema sp.]